MVSEDKTKRVRRYYFTFSDEAKSESYIEYDNKIEDLPDLADAFFNRSIAGFMEEELSQAEYDERTKDGKEFVFSGKATNYREIDRFSCTEWSMSRTKRYKKGLSEKQK